MIWLTLPPPGLSERNGLDLTSYKQRQMQRRIDQWMNRHGLSYNDLIAHPGRPREKGGILRLSNHQHFQFFRQEVFDNIKDPILPNGRQNIAPGLERRDIHRGRSIQHGHLAAGGKTHYSILATDIDEEALQQARRLLPGTSTARVPPGPQAYFTKEGDATGSSKPAAGIIFRRQQPLEDPSAGLRHDPVPNVFIYFTWRPRNACCRISPGPSPGRLLHQRQRQQMTDPASTAKRVAHCIYQLEK